MPTDEPPSMSEARAGSPPVRVIHTLGVEWRVYEQPSVYDRRTRPDLVFESESVIRRVRDYPTNWTELSDDELLAVSWSR